MVTGSSNHNIITPLHLSNSIQSAFEAIQRSQQDSPLNDHHGGGNFPYNNNNAASNRKQRRRSSLPADPSLFKALKRTPSHKRFPHLNPTKSIPFGFSPATTGLDIHNSLLPGLRPSKSHCNLPHLPCTPVSRSRRGSLPANFKMKDQSIYEDVTPPQQKRRGSYPLTEEMVRQRELHRCKAKHKANITLTHLLNEWKKKSEQLKSETKRVKSEPHIRNPYSKSSSVLSSVKKNETNMVRSSSLFANFDIVGHMTSGIGPPNNASSTGVIKQNYAFNNDNSSRHYAPSSSYLVHVHYTDSQAVRSLSKPSSIHHHQHKNHQSRRTSSILAKAT